MPKGIHIKPGSKVNITCYYKGCEGVSIPVTLGRVETEVNPRFIAENTIGTIEQDPKSTVKGFSLSKRFGGSGDCKCPKCGALFVEVLVVLHGHRKRILFGYEAEGC